MKTTNSKKSSIKGKCSFTLSWVTLFLFTITSTACVYGQSVLFDFDNAPIYTPLPITQTAGGITAHFSGTGQGYSIQSANTMGFTPAGFGGLCIYPSSVFLADLLIAFDQTITDFTIMYACQELGCDDAATMRVTAYMNGAFVGSNTKTASVPGTWPSDSLSCNFIQGFDSVVIHYDSPPPTCQDYGVIFMTDNMRVTAGLSSIFNPKPSEINIVVPNPVTQPAVILLSLYQPAKIVATIYDITGRKIKILFDGSLYTGDHYLKLDLIDNAMTHGLFYLNIESENFSQTFKLLVVQ